MGREKLIALFTPPAPVKRWSKTILLLMAFFSALRLILFIYTRDLAVGVSLPVLLKSFLIGLRFDLNVAFSLCTPFFIIEMFLPSALWDFRRAGRFFFRAFLPLAWFCFLLAMIDLEFFREYNQRVNGILLHWKEEAAVSLGMAFESFPLIRVLLFLVFTCGLFAWLVGKGFRKPVLPAAAGERVFWMLIAALVSFVAIRGRFEAKTTLNISVASFSPHPYANKLCLNSAYSFFRDFSGPRGDLKASVSGILPAMSSEEASAGVSAFLGEHREKVFSGPASPYKNTVLVLSESFAAWKTGVVSGKPGLSPCFDSLAMQGVLFTRFYSNGIHTFSGVFSTLFGLPNLPGVSMMKRPEGRFPLGGMASALKAKGYHAFFFSPHDPHFDNMQGVFYNNGFERIFGPGDYGCREATFMGVTDACLYNEVLARLPTLPQPFFLVILTGTNHPPYFSPDSFTAPAGLSKEDRAFLFADQELGKFMARASALPAMDSTLYAVTGDHGMYGRRAYEVDIDKCWVPLLLYSPGLLQPSRVDRVGGQLDLFPTLMGLLRMDYRNTSFGRDLLSLDSSAVGFAPFVDHKAAGALSEKGLFIFDPGKTRRFYPFEGGGAPDSLALNRLTAAFLVHAAGLYAKGTAAK